MKVLLTSLSIDNETRVDFHPDTAYSLGLAYLYSVLELNNFIPELLFLDNYNEEDSFEILINKIEEFNPDIVAFQIFSMNRVATFHAIDYLNYQYENIKIIIGGIHTSIMYEQILAKYNNVIAVIGEGEITIIELLDCLKNNEDLSRIKGIAYYHGNTVVKTVTRDLISDLDSLPFAKHDVFFINNPSRQKAHIITSRGCPFDCSFCCLKIISKRKYRERKIENVVREIVELKRKYPQLKEIQFHDDTFLLNNKRVIEFCKLIIKENIGITFECSARVKPVSDELFYWLERAGCTKVMFGLETGSEKLLNNIHKNILKEDVVKLFIYAKKYNFTITTFLMCGFPGESEETIFETIELVQKIQKIKYSLIVGIGILWVYPGTEVYEIMKNKKAINDDYWMSNKSVPYFTVEHSFEKLQEFSKILMDHLSFENIRTWNGFKKHFLKMPLVIIKFILTNPILIRRFIQKPFYYYSITKRTIKNIIKYIIRWDYWKNKRK